jgi:hypothetical protein
MPTAKTIAGGALLLVLAASTTSAEVQLSIRDGRVTLVATNATVRQILTEWARVGQTKIVNVDRIPGGPLTLQFTNLPEQEALDILLRSVTGYMAAARPVPVATLSHYDRILVLATAATPRVPVAAAPAPASVQRTLFPPPAAEDNDEQPNVVQQPRGPLFPTFQQPQLVIPQSAVSATPGAVPPQPAPIPPSVVIDQLQNGRQPVITPFPGATGGGAVGAPRPGMVVQPPAQPGVIQLGQPGQPVAPQDH